MTEPERSHLSGKALEAYDRMLERVQIRLHDLQETSLQTLEEEVQKAVEFEYELEEMTRLRSVVQHGCLHAQAVHPRHTVQGSKAHRCEVELAALL